MNGSTVAVIVAIVIAILAVARRRGAKVTQVTRARTHEEDEDGNA